MGAACAFLKSRQYHDYGQLGDEQWATLFLVAFSAACVVATLALTCYQRRTPRRGGAVVAGGACLLAIVLDVAAVISLTTATKGAKDVLFP